MDYTGLLASYAARLRYEDLPQKTVEKTKRVILHVLSAALAGNALAQARNVTKLAAKKATPDGATIWGSRGVKAYPEEAAFANATMADMLDWEDCSWTGHPSAGAVPVALALGEAKHLSGKEVITAIVTAYDVYQRLAMAVQPSADEWGKPGHNWGLTSWQVFAASVAAAKLYGFDADQMATSLGVTTHFTAIQGPAREDSDVYHYAHGICARNGIAVAEIVEAGVDPIRHTLDGPHGLWRQWHETADLSWYEKDLGTWFAIDDTLLKHWPANMWIQAPLDALAALAEAHQLSLDEIEKVEITPDVGLYSAPMSEPRTIMKAEFSLAYCFAAYLQTGKATAAWYDEERLQDQAVMDFEKKFVFLPPQRTPIEQFMYFWKRDFPETTVRLHLRNGSVVEKTLKYPKGHPRNPFTWEEEKTHFLSAVECLDDTKKERIVQLVETLETLPDVAALCELLVR